jgi:3'-5' exoribonuclease
VLVKHLLLSHHGQYEYGSPKRPKTLEAVILNFLDDLDSKINGVRAHIERESVSGSAWTSYHRLYDRYFFKDGGSAGPGETATAETAPLVAVAPQPAAPKPASPAPAAEPRGRSGKQFGFTLADQLKGKSLDLFAADEAEKE